MDQMTAQAVFFAIMGVGVVVWAWSLNRAASLGHSRAREQENDDPFADNYADTGFNQFSDRQDVITGQKTVRGTCDSVSRSLAKALLNTTVPGMFAGLFEIVEQTPQTLLIRKTGPLVCNQPTGLYFSEAEFRFERESEHTVVVHYCIGFDRLAAGLRRIAIGIIMGVGLPIMILVGCLIWFLVISSDNPDVRWQVFQAFHIGHALWPPFLIISFYRSGRKHSRTHIANLLTTVDLMD